MQVGGSSRRSSPGLQTTGQMWQRFGNSFERQRGMMRAAASDLASVGADIVLAVNTFNQSSPTIGLYRQRAVAPAQRIDRSV